MATLIALVLALWGVTFTHPIFVNFHTDPALGIGFAYVQQLEHPDGPPVGSCTISFDEARWATMTQAQRESLALHEVGHCLGLGHYGSCNANLSIMGCPSLGRVTGYDRAMGAGNRLFVPMVVY
jgi:hypothetical protein